MFNSILKLLQMTTVARYLYTPKGLHNDVNVVHVVKTGLHLSFLHHFSHSLKWVE